METVRAATRRILRWCSAPCLFNILWFVVGGLMLPFSARAEIVNTKLSGPMVTGGGIVDFKFSPDGNWVVYRADQDTDNAFELYSVPLAGGPVVRLNNIIPADSLITDYEITSDSTRVVFLGPLESVWKQELYSVPIEGPAGARIKINDTLAGDEVHAFEVSPDGQRVVYLAPQKTPVDSELYSYSFAEGSPAAQISLPTSGFGQVWPDFRISPDGARVVYAAQLDDLDRKQLYSVPIEGPSSASVRLNGPLGLGGDVYSFQINPAGTHVVYRADQLTNEIIELFSVPIDGPTGLNEKLNGPLLTGGDVITFQISPEGDRVVYDARQTASGATELYSVPLAGPASSYVQLNGPLPTGGNFLAFEISPDGRRVVYAADQDVDDVIELYSVPIDGPAGNGVRLNKNLVSGGDVSWGNFRIDSDSRRVVYQADQETDEVLELFSVAISGRGGGLKLNKPLGAAGDVSGFRLSPDGRQVIYRADPTFLGFGNEVFRLYMVPIEGGAASLLVNGRLVQDGDVHTDLFDFAPDSQHVVYVADQDTDTVNELYVSYDKPTAVGVWQGYR